MANEYGQKMAGEGSLDSSLTVSAASTGSGTGKDIGANTSPQSIGVDAQFSFTQTGATDTGVFEVRVQFSDDNSTWPDAGQGYPVFGWTAGSAGADLTLSEFVRFVPLRRYFRFRVTNNNATDSVDFDSVVALTTLQDNAA